MPSADYKPKTLYDKVLDAHIVNEQEDGTILLYIGGLWSQFLAAMPCTNRLLDRHLVHEVTSPVCSSRIRAKTVFILISPQQAFEGLKNASRKVRRPDCTLVTVDHVCKSIRFIVLS